MGAEEIKGSFPSQGTGFFAFFTEPLEEPDHSPGIDAGIDQV